MKKSCWERVCVTFDFPMCDVKGWHVRSSTVQQDANLTPRSLHKATGLNSVNAKKDGKNPACFLLQMIFHNGNSRNIFL